MEAAIGSARGVQRAAVRKHEAAVANDFEVSPWSEHEGVVAGRRVSGAWRGAYLVEQPVRRWSTGDRVADTHLQLAFGIDAAAGGGFKTIP